MRVAAVVGDLILFSRIDEAARRAGASLVRLDSPAELPPELDLVLVDWATRADDWIETLKAWSRGAPTARLVLFGPHTDLRAHAAARAAGMGPMVARSKVIADLESLLRQPGAPGPDGPPAPYRPT